MILPGSLPMLSETCGSWILIFGVFELLEYRSAIILKLNTEATFYEPVEEGKIRNKAESVVSE